MKTLSLLMSGLFLACSLTASAAGPGPYRAASAIARKGGSSTGGGGSKGFSDCLKRNRIAAESFDVAGESLLSNLIRSSRCVSSEKSADCAASFLVRGYGLDTVADQCELD